MMANQWSNHDVVSSLSYECGGSGRETARSAQPHIQTISKRTNRCLLERVLETAKTHLAYTFLLVKYKDKE